MQQSSLDRPLLDVERTILVKERATLLDRLRLVETMLGVPPTVPSKRERQQEKLQERSGTWGRHGHTSEPELS